MKNFLNFIIILFLFQFTIIGKSNAGYPDHIPGKDDKKHNLLKISDFSILSVGKDTLYLREGNKIAENLFNLWNSGEFRDDEIGSSVKVFLIPSRIFDSFKTREVEDSEYLKLFE